MLACVCALFRRGQIIAGARAFLGKNRYLLVPALFQRERKPHSGGVIKKPHFVALTRHEVRHLLVYPY